MSRRVVSRSIAQTLRNEIFDHGTATGLGQIGAALAAFVLLARVPVPGHAGWLAAILALGSTRLVAMRLSRRPIPAAHLLWYRAAIVTTSALWTGWLASAILTGEAVTQAMALVFCSGLVAGAGLSLYFDQKTFFGFVGPLLAGSALALLVAGQAGTLALAGVTIVFAGVVTSGVRARYRAHVQLLESHEELARQQRELEQLNVELAAAKDDADAALETRRLFIANISHEIRTPLNGIIGMTRLLLDSELDDGQIECVGTIRACGDTLLDVITGVLDSAKIEAGRLELHPDEFATEELLREAIEITAPRAREKGILFHIAIDGWLPLTMHGDKARLRQVLLNFLGNAIKFTAAGEVELTARLATGPAGRALCVAVRDTGPGIDADQLPRLFQPFSQLDPSLARQHGGTGLGLLISRQLVELMGGSCEVASVRGEGSVFSFSVPLVGPTDGPTLASQAPELIAGRRMLVLDDSATGARTFAQQLADAGARVDTATDVAGVAALMGAAATASDPYRVIFFACRGSLTDAERQAHVLRTLPGAADATLVCLAWVGLRGDAARLRAEGCAGWLTLPVLPSRTYGHLLELATGQLPAYTPARRAGDDRFGRGGGNRPKPRILLAEDNPVNQRVALRILERFGLTADIAANGHEALAALAARPYDLLLTDIQMPGMDGLALAGEVRRLERGTRRLPIIAMTAHADADDRIECLKAGMDDYLSKPIQPEDLAATIERWTPTGAERVDEPVLA